MLAYVSSCRQRQVHLCQFEASLVSIVNSKPARARLYSEIPSQREDWHIRTLIEANSVTCLSMILMLMSCLYDV